MKSMHNRFASSRKKVYSRALGLFAVMAMLPVQTQASLSMRDLSFGGLELVQKNGPWNLLSQLDSAGAADILSMAQTAT